MLKPLNIANRLSSAVSSSGGKTNLPPLVKKEGDDHENQKSAVPTPNTHNTTMEVSTPTKSPKTKCPLCKVEYAKWRQHFEVNHWIDPEKAFVAHESPEDPEEMISLFFMKKEVPARLLPYYLIHFHRKDYKDWPAWCKEIAIYLKKTPMEDQKRPAPSKAPNDQKKKKEPEVADMSIDDYKIDFDDPKSSSTKKGKGKRKRGEAGTSKSHAKLTAAEDEEMAHMLSDDDAIHGLPDPSQEADHRAAKKKKTTTKSLYATEFLKENAPLNITVEEPAQELDPVIKLLFGDLNERASAAKTCGSKSSHPGGIKLLKYQLDLLKPATLVTLCGMMPCEEPHFSVGSDGVTFSWKGIFGKKKSSN